EGPFKAAMNRLHQGLAAVIGLAELCETSLTATAVSYARHTRDAVAVVQSTDGVIDFAILSDAMKVERLRWLRKGDRIPDNSVSGAFGQIQHNVDRALTSSGAGRLP